MHVYVFVVWTTVDFIWDASCEGVISYHLTSSKTFACVRINCDRDLETVIHWPSRQSWIPSNTDV